MAREQAWKAKGCSESCWVRNLLLPDVADTTAFSSRQDSIPSVDDKVQRAAAAKLYQTIKPWQTRILRIDPALRLDSPVLCALLIADVIVHEGLGIVEEDTAREAPYDALSYIWGAPVFSHPVQINGIQFFVTENLGCALRHLRLTNTERYLWVDALCINQFDVREKSVQVSRMFSIYKKAQSVIAWNSGWNQQKSAVLSTVLANASDDIKKHSEVCIQRLGTLSQLLVNACEPPLFKRTWVRQEVFAARNLVMQLGDLRLSWVDYERLKSFVARIGDLTRVRSESASPDFTDALYLKSPSNAIKTLVQPDYKYDANTHSSRNQGAINAPVSLLDALVFSSSFGVTDPRDLVYGILGFTTVPTSQGVTDIHRPALTVDYGRSVSEVFQDVVIYEINRTGSLGILDFASQSRPSSDLPSWVPDWRAYDPAISQHRVLNRTNSWRYGFVDVKRIGIEWKPLPPPPDACGVLFARGVVLGILKTRVDEDTAWMPWISDSFKTGFNERFGGRDFDCPDLFPGVRGNYMETFDEEFKHGNLPLHDGKVARVNVTNAGERLMTLLQSAMLEMMKFAVRGRVIESPEPVRGNLTLGLAPRGISLAPRGFVDDDIIVLFRGSPCPFVLRRLGQEQHVLIGRGIFPLLFEHTSMHFDPFRRSEMAWSSGSALDADTSDILESRLLRPEKMASIWKRALQDDEFLSAFEDFELV
ncbi:heterokaryon incompatibility protein-domain-containing protein [Durotheca rogersii]|uniref:heterokaryon incompatibility protein-domain-containing protein n=1 Tax=Durotheca rogersii TaxID=419775 RepID=UPI00221E7404|nr:heterokaryon incompatibility protein-domain-containing protein [Durotheca rogersii]KAI5867472.1 heterokaryon incompatibility protein-domain-containing protein [Durotheca rogersii]